jgi:hypothetical protein
MGQNKLNSLLNSPDKEVSKTSGANGVLSRLWRQMLFDLDITLPKFGAYLQAYILDPRNGVPNNRKDQISMRGNLTKEFTRSQMTWKVFCKALRFLNIVKIELIIKAHHHNGKITRHSTFINFGGRTVNNNFNELLEQDEDKEYVPRIDYLDMKD